MYTSFSKKRGRNEKEFFFFACTTIFQIQYTEISFANLVVFLSPPYSRNECEYNRTKIIRVFVGKNCGQVRQSRWSIALVKQYSAPLMYFIVPSKRYPHRSFLSPCHGTMSDRVWRFNREFTIAFDSSPWPIRGPLVDHRANLIRGSSRSCLVSAEFYYFKRLYTIKFQIKYLHFTPGYIYICKI